MPPIAAQRQALIALAQHQGGKLLENIARVDYVPVVLEVPANREGHAVLRAGHLATIITRPLNHHDHICGNETNFYPPLTNVQNATSAVALTDEFQGDGLDSQWSSHGRRSAYIAAFSEGGATVAAVQSAAHDGARIARFREFIVGQGPRRCPSETYRAVCTLRRLAALYAVAALAASRGRKILGAMIISNATAIA